MFQGEFKLNVAAVAAGMTYSSLERSNDGSRSAGEGLCVLQSFLFTTQQEH